MKHISILILIITFLNSCKKTDFQPEAKVDAYSVCTIDPIPEEDYSAWVPITDMQVAFNTRPSGTYWVHMEGRNNNGLSEFRWIQREDPWDKNDWWLHRSNLTHGEFFEIGMKKRSAGYKRVSLQVFVDGSGVARYQALWIKEFPATTVLTSSLLKSDLAKHRNEHLSAWVKGENIYSKLKKENITLCPLYIEFRDEMEVRVLTDDSFTIKHRLRWGCNKHYLLKYHKEHTANGYSLLSLSQFKISDQKSRYCAIWVKDEDLPEALKQLKKMGISHASIKAAEQGGARQTSTLRDS